MMFLLHRLCNLQLFTFLIATSLFGIIVLKGLVGVSAEIKAPDLDVYEENEFAEFEDQDDDQEQINNIKLDKQDSKKVKDSFEGINKDHDDDNMSDDEVTLEDDVDIFEDSEEFESSDSIPVNIKGSNAKKADKIEITKVPMHMRTRWESYLVEGIMLLGIVIYFFNFVSGRNKNQAIADMWLETHRDILESNFALVGDDGKKDSANRGFIKETENVFLLWCSGRTCVEGMLTELRLLKRQDLVSNIIRLFSSSHDEMLIKVYLNSDAMDTFVFCIANKSNAIKLVKEMNDLATFCPERKSADKFGINDNFVMMNEIGEVASALLDSKLVNLLNKCRDAIQYIHISDQYSGLRLSDDTPLVKLPERRKIMMFGFKYPTMSENNDEILQSNKPLVQLVFYLIERVRRLRLNREGKNKADKNRQKVEEIFLKATHSQRQEAAQAKREERKRAEKEKMLNEEDPEKQRKWEEREHRREMKKKASRFKQIKIRAM